MKLFICLVFALCISPLLSIKNLRSSSSAYCPSSVYAIRDTTTKLWLKTYSNSNSVFFSGRKTDYFCFSPAGVIVNFSNGLKLFHHSEKVDGVLKHTIGFDDGRGYANSDYQWSIVKDYNSPNNKESFYERVFFNYNDGDVSEVVSLGATPTKIASGNWRDAPLFNFNRRPLM